MKNGLLSAFVMTLATVAVAQAENGRYSEQKQGARPPAAARAAEAPAAPKTLGSLTFYSARALFDAAHPGLPVENFSATLVPANSVALCPSPINSASSDACFAPGGIRPGISVVNSVGTDMAVLTPPFFGVNCVSAGPDQFSEHGELQFAPPVEAVGLDLESNVGGVYTIEVFSPTGSLGTTTVTTTGIPGIFFGVDTSDAGGISRITFNAPGSTGELFCNVAFGQPLPVELQSFEIR